MSNYVGASRLNVAITILILVSIVGVGLLYFYSVDGLGFRDGGGVIRVAIPENLVCTADYMDVMRLDAKHGFSLSIMRYRDSGWVSSALVDNDVDIALVSIFDAADFIMDGVDVLIIDAEMYSDPVLLSPEVEGVASSQNSSITMFFRASIENLYNISLYYNHLGNDTYYGLSTTRLDGVIIDEPVLSRVSYYRGVNIILSLDDLLEDLGLRKIPLYVWIVGRTYYIENPDVVERFIDARVEAASGWINNKNIVIDILMDSYGFDEDVAEMLYNRLMIYPNYLDELLIRDIRNLWDLAYRVGVLDSDPSLIMDSVFIRNN